MHRIHGTFVPQTVSSRDAKHGTQVWVGATGKQVATGRLLLQADTKNLISIPNFAIITENCVPEC